LVVIDGRHHGGGYHSAILIGVVEGPAEGSSGYRSTKAGTGEAGAGARLVADQHEAKPAIR
jgi:hypothetical protein